MDHLCPPLCNVQWMKWLGGIVKAEVGERELPNEQHVHQARKFLMEWSFYSSLIIRDLTLRSAQTFGSFHLIRLLFDEYVLYKVEKQVCLLPSFCRSSVPIIQYNLYRSDTARVEQA